MMGPLISYPSGAICLSNNRAVRRLVVGFVVTIGACRTAV
jgi:hypothetical protein